MHLEMPVWPIMCLYPFAKFGSLERAIAPPRLHTVRFYFEVRKMLAEDQQVISCEFSSKWANDHKMKMQKFGWQRD